MRHPRIALLLSCLLVIGGTVASTRAQGIPAGPERRAPALDRAGSNRIRKLIEFGWDEPDPAFLRMHQHEVERTPFDGCVFHVNSSEPGKPPENFTWLCWGRRTFTEQELAAAVNDLKAISWHRFTENFLRFNVAPGDLDWFDDYSAVIANARLAGRIVREGRCRGILLDTEQYEKPIFSFRKQPDAGRRSWEEYAAQARRRGREVMTAFQETCPGLTLMVTFGPSLVWVQSQRGDAKRPLAETEDGLLVPFFDGLVEGAAGATRVVDGFELSYGYRTREEFVRGRDLMTSSAASLMADPAAYRRLVAPGFGLWLDRDWRKLGWKTDDLEANYFSPSRFLSALRDAMEVSDEYVWIYTETPRWWSAAGKREKLPEAYEQAIRAARRGLCAD